MITSAVGGEEEARSAALGEDYQVLKALSAGSLMLVLRESSLVCLGHAQAACGLRCFSQHALDRLKSGQPAGRLCLARVTTWLIAPEQHPPPHQARPLPGFFTHFTILGLRESNPRVL